MAQPFQNIGQRPFEAQNFRRNFTNNFDTVVVSGFPRYIQTKQIVDFFILREGDCVCVATKKNPPSVLLQFSSPIVAEKVVLRYNNSEVCGQRLQVVPSNNWHSSNSQVHGKPAEIPPLMSNDAYIPSRRVQVPLQPVIGTSLLNLAKALLIQKNNLIAIQNQWNNQTSSPQRNFPAWGSPTDNQQRIGAGRGHVWRPSDASTRHAQKDTADMDQTNNHSDKNSLVKKPETAQEVFHSTDKFPKDKSIKRNEEIKGPVIRRKRLRRTRSRERRIQRTTQTAVPKGSLGVTSSAGKNMDKNDSSSLQNTSQDSEIGKKCSTNSNKNSETGSKATMEKLFDGCKINTEGGMETKPKEDGASTDGVKSTASWKENPVSHGSGSERECLTRIDCKKDKGTDKTIPNDSVIKNEKRAAGMKDKSVEEGSQGTASKHECPLGKSNIKANEGSNTPTRKDSVLENESTNGSVEMSSESKTKCPTNKSNDTYIGNEITKKDSSIESRNTGDVAKSKDTESRIVGANNFCAKKNCSTGNMDVNLGTTPDSSGSKRPNAANNDGRNVGTGSEIASIQNKNKTEPQNINVKNRSQASRSPQKLPNDKESSLENRQKKDEKRNKTESGLKRQRRSSKDDELKQVNDSVSAARKNLTQRNLPTSKLAKNNKDSLSDSIQPHASQNMQNGGNAKPRSSVSRTHYYARRNQWDSIRYRKRVNELSPRARSVFAYRNRVSPSRDATVFGRTRSPDKTLLRNQLVRSSDEGRARKRVFEVTGLVASSPKRKRLNDKSADRIAPKKVSDTAFKATNRLVALPKGSCLDDQNITCADKNGSKKAGSQNESVSKKTIDTAFKATGLVVAPPKRKSLNNATAAGSKDMIDRKNVADTTFKVTGLVLAPPKKKCLDDQSTKKKKIGSSNEFVPKNVIDTTCKATSLIVAPPKGGCLDNKSSQSNYDQTGPKGVFGLKDLRDVVIERHSEQRFGTMKEQKNSNQKRSDDIRLGKQSDTKNISTKKNKKCRESSPVEITSKDCNLKRSDCLSFGKGQTASDELNSAMKDSSKNLEERELTITKTSAKDGTEKNGDDPNLSTVQAVSDMLETFDISVDLSMRKKPKYHGSTIAETSVGDTTVESSDYMNNDKLQSQGNALKNSDLIMNSLKNVENDVLTVPKCSSEPKNDQGSSDCTDLKDKKDVVGHELENFSITKELSTEKKPENNRLTRGNICSEYFQKRNDGTNVGKVELACDVVKNDLVKNSAPGRKSDDKGFAVTNISSEQNNKKNYDRSRLCKIQVARDSLKNPELVGNMSIANTPRDGDIQNKIKKGCKENPILVSEGHIDMKEHNLTKENQHLVKQVQGDDSHEKDLYRKIPVSPCTVARSLNVSSNNESSCSVKDEHTTFNEINSDKSKGSLAADIMQRNIKNTDCVPNTDCLKDSIRGHIEHNQCVGAFSTVISTDHSENENSEAIDLENENNKANHTTPRLSDKVSSKENCSNRNVLKSQESPPTVSKAVPSKTTTLASCVSNMLAKLKILKTNAQKISKNQNKANAATSKDKSISVKINSALHSRNKEGENSAENLSTSPNSVFESKSVFVKDNIGASTEAQSGLATVSKYFACQKNSIDKESNAGVCDDKLEPGLKEFSGSNQDCLNSKHKSTDAEQQPVITCDSVKKAGDNFPNANPANEILPELKGVSPIVPSLSRKSSKPQSDGKIIMICTAKKDGQKADNGENEETEMSKSAEPNSLLIGANTPINMQIPFESRAGVKDIEISDPKILPGCIYETVKENTTIEVFSQENTSNVVSDVAEQPKAVCGSSGTKSSSTSDGVASLKKSTTTTIEPALQATEKVKRLETDVVLVTEDHPMCIDLSTVDLQNNSTRIASTGISDVKKETQFQNEPSFANDNSSFENNASENNQEQEPTSVTCDDVNTANNENYGFTGNENTQMLLNKDLQSGCNEGNSVQSSVTCTDDGRGQNVNYLSVNCQEILNRSECENLSNGGNSVHNDGQDGNLTGDTVIAGKRKREDELVNLAGNKHQKCQNLSQGKNQLNETQSNQSNEQTAGNEGMKMSKKERKGQEQERRFLCKNILAIEEQYDKESVALLKNVKMLARVDPSLTEKLKGAFKDSLAEIGQKYLSDLHKLKEKNDSYKNQRKNAMDKGAVPPENPKNRQGWRTRQNRTKVKPRQGNPNIQQKKGNLGNVNQKNATKKQQGTGKTVNNGQINNQQTVGKMSQNKLQMNAFNASQSAPLRTPKGGNCKKNPICNV